MVRRAVVVIDVQQEYETGAMRISYPPLAGSLAAIGRVMDAAHEHRIPVVVVQQDAPATSPIFAVGSPGWRLHPEVADRHRDVLFHKRLPGAFTGTELEAWLRDRGIDTVTLVGYMTQHCVGTTARQASHLGLAVEVLADATGTLDYRNEVGAVDARSLHHGVLTVLHAGFAAVATTDDWLAALPAKRRLPAGSLATTAAVAPRGAHPAVSTTTTTAAMVAAGDTTGG
ncbi:cysteine hydrolase family protein [Parafrankia sp. EUN1f]|uniref:cysteine hydrolase family protein n=1 Tax=Parafrankia sp. EUN1f TaxID=102897 RepID=UPI0001C4423F|nr:cysteine hydrolase family protein [Parafrankia sp. EUN1f]EFC85808.1 isochorismatase hydrolase [Parafrankia sp. EUN1f]